MAEGHTEHSNLEKTDRESRLDANVAEPSAKRPSLDECTTSKVSSASQPSVVHGNCACVSFDGFKGTNVSLPNNTASETEPAEEIITLNEEEGVKSCK